MTADQRDRLLKLLAMLGSDQLGERAVAAKKVEEHRAELGLEWGDLIVDAAGNLSAFVTSSPAPAAPPPTDGIDPALPRDLIDGYGDPPGCGRLTRWEIKFLSDIDATMKSGGRLSAGMKGKLLEIAKAMAAPPPLRRRTFGV